MRLRIIKNVFANWLGYVSTVIAGFFLTPFILHRIGDVAFGLWILMSTFTGYYGILDFGIRNAVIRYVAQYGATDDQENLNRVASTSLSSYSAMGLVVLIVSLLLAWKIDWVFHISPQWVHAGRQLIVITGLGTALGFPLIFFGGMLEGLQKFTWVGGVQTIATILRTVLIVLALHAGYGVVALGVIFAITNVFSSAVYLFVAFRVCPRLRVRWSYMDKSTLRTLAVFGLVTFWIQIAAKLRFQSDSFVIATFLSVQAITVFSIGSKLVMYTTDFVQTMATVFTPMFSHYNAKGDLPQLSRILLLGNRYSALLMFPLASVLVMMGRSLIRVWVGAQYDAGYVVLVILALGMTLYTAQAASNKVLYGMGRHKTLAKVLLAEGIANLLLSILLLRWYGIYGVALGTVIPLAITSLLFLPFHVSRQVGLPVGRYLRESLLLPLLPAVPLVIALWFLDRWLNPRGYAGLALELGLGGIVYGLALLLFMIRAKETDHFLAIARGKLVQRSAED